MNDKGTEQIEISTAGTCAVIVLSMPTLLISMATLSKDDPGVSVIIIGCLVFTRTSFFN